MDPTVDDAKKNAVTVTFHNDDHPGHGRTNGMHPPKPPPSLIEKTYGKIRSIHWMRLIVAIVWEVAGLAFLALIYLLVTSQGLSELCPPVFGQRMSRLPGFAWMANYAGWHRATVGQFAAMGLMIFVAVAWFLLVRDLLLTQGNRLDEAQWKMKNARWYWRVAGIGLLVADGILFFRGLVDIGSWAGSSSYFAAMVLTVVYLAALMVFSFVSVLLWSNVRRVQS